MNQRERFVATMEARGGVAPPNYELGLWGQTIERWVGEGAKEEEIAFDWFRGGKQGLDRRDYAAVYTHAFPRFDEIVIEEDDEYVIHQDSQGVITRSLKAGKTRGSWACMDQHLSHPVRDRATFLELKKRYIATSPERYPKDWPQLVEHWRRRDYPVCLQEVCGFGLFSHLRIWMGTEALCIAFYEQRTLVEEMLDFLVEFFCQTVSRAVQEVQFDYFNFFEDFAYNAGPFTSPLLFRELFLPRFRAIVNFLKRHGVRYFWLDSDGNTEALIPIFIEMGINCHWPVEVAAGMDPVKLKREYGRDLVLKGGIDKRVLARGKREIEEELQRKLPPLIEAGGYIPMVDHTVPPDVPYENFLHYMEIKRQILSSGH